MTCDGYRVQYNMATGTGMTLDGAFFILEVSLYVLRSHQAMAQNFFTSYYNVMGLTDHHTDDSKTSEPTSRP